MNNSLHIITPLSRTEFIVDLYQSIKEASNDIKIYWWIVVDNKLENKFKTIHSLFRRYEINLNISVWFSQRKENSPGGHAHRNEILHELDSDYYDENEWLYSLDDDNILHPNFIKALKEIDLTGYDVLAGDQYMKDGRLRLVADDTKMKVCHVDTASCAFRLGALRGLRYEENDYCGDGLFVEKVHNLGKRFFYLHQPMCYYNYLRD